MKRLRMDTTDQHVELGGKTVVHVENVSFAYNGEAVLHDVSLTIREKEFVWIVGPNGGGKTTLIKLILGLLQPKSGRITVFGASVGSVRQRIGYMPQHAHLDQRFPVRVIDVALMGRLRSGAGPAPYTKQDRRAALEALEQVGLSDLLRRTLAELSGGQQRRLLIARALASQPDLLVLDEPTANLDIQIEGELFELLRKLNKHLTVVMVSHDPTIVSEFVEHVVCVNHTLAVHPTGQLDRRVVSELYGAPRRIVRHDIHQDGEEPHDA
jgi:zinc transport system ATP-binding protein